MKHIFELRVKDRIDLRVTRKVHLIILHGYINSNYDHSQFKYMFHIFIFIKFVFISDCRTLHRVRNKLSEASVLIRSKLAA